MKFSLLTENFKKKVLLADRFTGKNATLPILATVLLKAEGQTIILTTTNLENACILKIPAKIEKEGVVALPSQSFASYVQLLSDNEKITCEQKNEVFSITTPSIHTKIKTFSEKDFPIIPKIKKEKQIILSKKDFQEAVRDILPAVSTSQLKPELNGVYIHWNKDTHTMVVVGTDTFRLAEKKLHLPDQKSDDFSFIFPYRAAQEFTRFESDDDGCTLTYGESQIHIMSGGNEFISNTTNGLFPQYTNIIPKKYETYIELDVGSCIQAIKSSSFFSSKLQDIRLSIESDSSVEIHSENNELGESTISLKARAEGNLAKISFNHKFFLDGVSHRTNGKVRISLNTENSPALIQNTNDPLFSYLLMPIKGI